MKIGDRVRCGDYHGVIIDLLPDGVNAVVRWENVDDVPAARVELALLQPE